MILIGEKPAKTVPCAMKFKATQIAKGSSTTTNLFVVKKEAAVENSPNAADKRHAMRTNAAICASGKS